MPLGATLADGAGAAEALATGAEAEALGAAEVPPLPWLQESQPAVSATVTSPTRGIHLEKSRTAPTSRIECNMDVATGTRGREAVALQAQRPVKAATAAVPLLLACALLLATSPARAAEPVHVLLPDNDNLQYLAFWTAKGAGYFDAEGVTVDTFAPEVPAQAIAKMLGGEASVAVLPPPIYLQLIADRFPVVLVANLLQNDPINVLVRRSVFEERHMDAHAAIRERLSSLRDLRVCVAPGPPARLRALFASVGMDADRDVDIVIRRGAEQNAAFANHDCDVLYSHTPYLEHALDDQDAVMLVDQSAGDVPSLSMRQIHALVVRREYLDAHRATVAAMVRAVGRGERLVHDDLAASEDAVMRALPALERRHVHTLLGLYQPAVPADPRVTVDGLAPALALFPASRTAPTLDRVPLADFVANVTDAPAGGAAPAPAHAARSARALGWVAALVALLLGLAVIARRARAGPAA